MALGADEGQPGEYWENPTGAGKMGLLMYFSMKLPDTAPKYVIHICWLGVELGWEKGSSLIEEKEEVCGWLISLKKKQ